MLLPPAQRALAKWVGLVVSLAVLAVAVVLAISFDTNGPQYQFVETRQWIPAFGTGYTLGLDGIALALVLLTAVLVPLAAGGRLERRRRTQAGRPHLRRADLGRRGDGADFACRA